jgi:hypothetical protein
MGGSEEEEEEEAEVINARLMERFMSRLSVACWARVQLFKLV